MRQERRVCDKQTRFNFRWSHVAEGVSILMLVALGYGVWDMREFMRWSQQFHDDIPDSFFKGDRWSFADEMRSQASTNQRISLISERMSLIESEHKHMMSAVKRIEDAAIR